MDINYFHKYFGYGSILPLLMSILGVCSIYAFLLENNFLAIIIMIINLTIYILNNILTNYFKKENEFNDFLENIGALFAFGIPIIIFGMLLYQENYYMLGVVLVYTLTLVLSLSRNKILSFKNSVGMPVPVNGIFFIFFYSISNFMKDEISSLFVGYYILISVFTISNANFLSRKINENNDLSKDDEDKEYKANDKNKNNEEVTFESTKESENILNQQIIFNKFFENQIFLIDTKNKEFEHLYGESLYNHHIITHKNNIENIKKAYYDSFSEDINKVDLDNLDIFDKKDIITQNEIETVFYKKEEQKSMFSKILSFFKKSKAKSKRQDKTQSEKQIQEIQEKKQNKEKQNPKEKLNKIKSKEKKKIKKQKQIAMKKEKKLQRQTKKENNKKEKKKKKQLIRKTIKKIKSKVHKPKKVQDNLNHKAFQKKHL